jgi:hypothetical protein
MLTGFLGRESMRELGLPVRMPWAFAYLIPLNTLRYRVFDALPGGTRRRERWGRASSKRVVDSYFLKESAGVASLPLP